MTPKTPDEARGNVENFAIDILEKMKEIKLIKDEIKEIKQNYKEEGVPVGVVSSMISKIKAEKKKSDAELFESETIKEWLEANTRIDDAIGELE